MAPGREQVDPLASDSLLRRFPSLREAMDAAAMHTHLQEALFANLTVESVDRPKAELSSRTCSFQYSLQLRTAGGEKMRAVVLATMFQDAAEAAAHERDALRAVAADWIPPREVRRATAVLEPLCLSLSVFPVNAALPSLALASDAEHMTPVLRELLEERELTVSAVELVVFRRTRGCVLRYRLASDRHPRVYGKVGYTATSPGAVRRALDALTRVSPDGAGPRLRFPRMLGRVDGLELSLMDEVPGARADLRVERDVQRLIDAAAGAAALLHTTRFDAENARSLSDEIERARQSVALLGSDAPPLSQGLTELIDRIGAVTEATSGEPSVFCHGDLTPSQLLFDGADVGLLDFDKLCQAEPAQDLGRFLAYLRFKLAKHHSADAETLAARFLDMYRRASRRDVSVERVRLYELAALIRMAARSWLQLKPARLGVVLDVLERAS